MRKSMVSMVRMVRALGFAVLLAWFGSGCGTPQQPIRPGTPSGAGAADVAPVGPDVVRIGDKIEVTFSDVVDYLPAMTQRVREDGSITLPYGVRIDAAQKKAVELQQAIQDAYVPKFFKRLTVSVKLEERMFYVGGQVRSPNRYVFLGEMTVLGAIKVAGDFTEFAKRTAVKVTRADSTEIVVDCKKALKNSKFDVPVYPGDSIYVPRRVLWD